MKNKEGNVSVWGLRQDETCFFKKKKPNPKPLGVPLGDLHTILPSTTLGSKLGQNKLEVTYDNLKAVLSIEEPPFEVNVADVPQNGQ